MYRNKTESNETKLSGFTEKHNPDPAQSNSVVSPKSTTLFMVKERRLSGAAEVYSPIGWCIACIAYFAALTTYNTAIFCSMEKRLESQNSKKEAGRGCLAVGRWGEVTDHKRLHVTKTRTRTRTRTRTQTRTRD